MDGPCVHWQVVRGWEYVHQFSIMTWCYCIPLCHQTDNVFMVRCERAIFMKLMQWPGRLSTCLMSTMVYAYSRHLYLLKNILLSLHTAITKVYYLLNAT